MIDLTKDIQPLTTFRRNSAECLKRVKKTKRPLVLTVNGKAAAVLQDVKEYQRMLDVMAKADASEGIRQGLEDSKRGRGTELESFLADFEAEHGISG